MSEGRESASRFRRQALRPAVLFCALLLSASAARAQVVKLERGWQFIPDREGSLKASNLGAARSWRDVRVGLSWNAQFPDLRDYMGVAWYRTTLGRPDLSGGRRALLRIAT